MKKSASKAAAACVFAFLAMSAHAAQDNAAKEMGKAKKNGGSSSSVELPWARGEVEDVDIANKYVILKHEPIKNLHMDAMTMAFAVKDPAMLSKMKVGDKVRFTAENVGDVTTIMSLEIEK